MRAILTSFLLAVMVVGALIEAGPRQAWACSCMVFPSDRHEAAERLERIGSATTVVVGVVEERTAEYPPTARVRTERVYKGRISKMFTVTSSDCNGLIADFKQGQRWLMELNRNDEGDWETGGCGAGVINPGGEVPLWADATAWAEALDHNVTLSLPPAGGGHDGLSLPVAALIAVSVGTLTLTGVWMAQRRMRDQA
jgi:hypothetical protein